MPHSGCGGFKRRGRGWLWLTAPPYRGGASPRAPHSPRPYGRGEYRYARQRHGLPSEFCWRKIHPACRRGRLACAKRRQTVKSLRNRSRWLLARGMSPAFRARRGCFKPTARHALRVALRARGKPSIAGLSPLFCSATLRKKFTPFRSS